eukprot:4932014-Prymnesium_polylepis.2
MLLESGWSKELANTIVDAYLQREDPDARKMVVAADDIHRLNREVTEREKQRAHEDAREIFGLPERRGTFQSLRDWIWKPSIAPEIMSQHNALGAILLDRELSRRQAALASFGKLGDQGGIKFECYQYGEKFRGKHVVQKLQKENAELAKFSAAEVEAYIYHRDGSPILGSESRIVDELDRAGEHATVMRTARDAQMYSVARARTCRGARPRMDMDGQVRDTIHTAY